MLETEHQRCYRQRVCVSLEARLKRGTALDRYNTYSAHGKSRSEVFSMTMTITNASLNSQN